MLPSKKDFRNPASLRLVTISYYSVASFVRNHCYLLCSQFLGQFLTQNRCLHVWVEGRELGHGLFSSAIPWTSCQAV